PAGPQPRLVVLRGLKVNMIYPIRHGSNLIGRPAKLPVDIDLNPQEDTPQPPCCFAQLKYENGELTIQDLSTVEGTHLNGTRIRAMCNYPLQAGDVIDIGPVQLKVTF